MLLECMDTKGARNLSSVELEVLREWAVKTVLEGTTRIEASKFLGVSRQAIGYWVREYKRKGAASLTYRKRGRRNRPQRLF